MHKDKKLNFFKDDSNVKSPQSLYDLNKMLRQGIRELFPESLWVQAEIAECNENASGHCYLELVEKQEGSDFCVHGPKLSFGRMSGYFCAKSLYSRPVAACRPDKRYLFWSSPIFMNYIA